MKEYIKEYQRRISTFYLCLALLISGELIVHYIIQPTSEILAWASVAFLFFGILAIDFFLFRCPKCNIWLERVCAFRYGIFWSIEKCPSCGVQLKAKNTP